MSGFVDDTRAALRALRRAPGYLAVAILTLTIGIGVNTTLFTLVNAVRFRPLPVDHVDELVDLHEDNPLELCAGCGVGTSWATWSVWAAESRSFRMMTAYQTEPMALAGGAFPERVRGARVTGTFFATVGGRAALGRTLQPSDDGNAGSRVVLLGHGIWQRVFGADSAIVGRTVRIDGIPHEVVGVAAPRVTFPDVEAWVPVGLAGRDMDHGNRNVGVVARLKPGVTVEQADAEVARLTAQVAATDPAVMRNWIGRASRLEDDLRADGGPPFEILLGAAALVLLLTCANLANVSLARGLARTGDFALRSAIGAPRYRAVRQLLLEGVIVALAGGLAALFVAQLLTKVAPAFLPSERPMWIEIAVDARVVAFTLGVAVLTGVLFTLAPAWRLGRADLYAQLNRGARDTGDLWSRHVMHGMIVLQLVLAVTLVSGAGLLLKTWRRIGDTSSIAYDPQRVATARLELGGDRYAAPSRIAAFGDVARERLAALPGVRAVALEGQEFLGAFVGADSRVTLEGAGVPVPQARAPRFALAVTPSWFEIRKLRLVRGRVFDEREREVIVVNEATADLLWPGLDAMGQRLKVGDAATGGEWLTVVGVVTNSGESRFARTPTPFLYRPWGDAPTSPTVHVETSSNASLVLPAIRRALASVDGDLTIAELTTAAASMQDSLTPVRSMTGLVGAMAAFALLLAVVGTFGLAAQMVERRRREFGVRMALGATPGAILALVLRHGTRLGAAGATLGVMGAWAATRLMRALLFGTDPSDPLLFAATAVVLFACAVAACVIPARRAAALAPSETLRAE